MKNSRPSIRGDHVGVPWGFVDWKSMSRDSAWRRLVCPAEFYRNILPPQQPDLLYILPIFLIVVLLMIHSSAEMKLLICRVTTDSLTHFDRLILPCRIA
jgi:hypothetical protein